MDLAWIGDVPEGIWVALVTGGFLVRQQMSTNRREDKRRSDDRDERERDRTHAKQLAEAERAATLQERWRDQRRQAYIELLEVADEMSRVGNRVRQRNEWFADDRGDEDELLGEVESVGNRLDSALAEVALYGSENAQAVANELCGVLSLIQNSAWATLAIKREAGAPILNDNLDRTADRREAFLNAARRDLGTL